MLSSCLLPKRKVQVQVKPVERAPLDLPPLAPLQLDGMNWYVVTESNFADIMAKLKASGMQPVIFSLDEKGYENLSVNMTKIRGYITQQKTVIVALKDYYNVPDNPETLTPPVTRLTQGTGLGIVTPAAPAAVATPAVTPAPAAAPAVVPAAPAAPTAAAPTASPAPAKKGMAKFIPPFMK